ncbi:MAG TPA: diguanylate cyclase [Vicinamibacterales bacterium]|nr:diguanylate cyclase [Vicinamibacterales bacterium]
MSSFARLRAVFAAKPKPLAIYVATVVATGAALLAYGIPQTSFRQPLLFLVLLLGSMTAAVMKIHLPLSSGQATLSMSYFTDFLSLVLLGPHEAMLVAASSAATQSIASKKGRFSARQTFFSSASLIITVQAAGFVSSHLGGFNLDASFSAIAKPAAGGAATFFLCNSLLVATAVALSRGRPIVETWQQDFLWAGPACFVAAGAATFAAAVMGTQDFWLVLFAAALLGLTFHSYRVYLGRVTEHQQHARVVQNLHLATVEALARAIDARDQTIDPESGMAENHIRRVEACAAALGEAAGMALHEIEGLKIASLLHDIGKLAVPEHILTKPGRLTPAEFDYIRLHPTVGANIIRAVPFPYPVAPYIQSHHERWDGTGYPEGLKGEAIPLGARVLAVVDYYDAITAHRPYHRAMAPGEAIETIKKEAGKALDPHLVELFIDVLAQTDVIAPPERAMLRLDPQSQRTGAPATGFSTSGGSVEAAMTVYQSISQATQEVRTLYDIAQTMGTRLSVDDTMGLLTSKLNRLVPASCWALYLPDLRQDVVRCRYAAGLSADSLEGICIPSGDGVTGWAARHHTAAVNARSSADFDAAGTPNTGTLFQSALAFPLMDNDRLVGILTAYHVDPQPYTDAHLRLLERLGGQAALVLANSIQFEGMRAASLTDSLTDLPNSRALVGHLDQRLARATEQSVPSALIMIDLDDFKEINDVHGHQVGDVCLQTLAGALRRHVRSTDFCARYGGDEFVVSLACQDRAEAERRASDLQRAVSRQRITAPDGSAIALSISVGVAMSGEDGQTFEALLEAADRRMYSDKYQRKLGARPREMSSIRLARSAS